MLSHKIDTLVVGGGQAGLSISYYLSQERREHVVLERAPAVANAWRNQRWDSFTLVTPNFQVRMLGAEYRGTDPYGFMSHVASSGYCRAVADLLLYKEQK
jgi:putative flavoprotein involved in K+ transport